MSQRQVLRRGDMELSSSGFQRQSAAPESTGDGNEEVAIRAGSNPPTFSSSSSTTTTTTQRQQLHQLRGGGEQDHLQLKSPAVTNGRFSLLDILRETIYLARARKTYLLVVLSIYIVGELLMEAFPDNFTVGNPFLPDGFSSEAKLYCERKILNPWRQAAFRGNLTSAKQEEFHTLFRQSCTAMYKSPAEGTGFFNFQNGTVHYRHMGFYPVAPPTPPDLFVVLAIRQMIWAWTSWAKVAVTLGLYGAFTRTVAYHRSPHYRDGSMHNNPPNTGTSSSPRQRLVMEALKELRSVRVQQGVLRVTLTQMPILIFESINYFIFTAVRSFVKDKSEISLASIVYLRDTSSPWWSLADPLSFLFLLAPAAAALEPGMWGFRALWRGIQLGRGNWLKSYLIYLLLMFWRLLVTYDLVKLFEFNAGLRRTETLSGALWLRWSIQQSSLNILSCMPKMFLVPVLYFLCKSRRERLATMA